MQPDVLPVAGQRGGTQPLDLHPLREVGVEALLGRLEPLLRLDRADLLSEGRSPLEIVNGTTLGFC